MIFDLEKLFKDFEDNEERMSNILRDEKAAKFKAELDEAASRIVYNVTGATPEDIKMIQIFIPLLLLIFIATIVTAILI